MSARRRRQHLKAINTRAWDPKDHNETVAMRKALRRASRWATQLARGMAKFGRAVSRLAEAARS